MSTVGNIVRVLLLLVLAAPLAHAVDTQAPLLHSITVSPDPAAAGSGVTITLRASDAGSGINASKLIAILLDPTGHGQVSITSAWQSVGADLYASSVTLSSFSVTGLWRVYAVLVYDGVGNGKMFLEGRDYVKKFTVTGPTPDGTPPELLGLTVAPTFMIPGSNASVSVAIRDPVSGVDLDHLYVNLVPENGGATYHVQVNQWTAAGPDLVTGGLVIPVGHPEGGWYVQSVFTRDLAGNAKHYFGGQDFNVTFDVGLPLAPAIFRQPESRLVTSGQTATFSVNASGTPPLTYQWFLNDVPVPGATAASYTTGPLSTMADGDAYFCVVSNPYGADTSQLGRIRFGLSDYQTIVSNQAPDYWFRLDNNLVNSGVAAAPDLARAGGVFFPDSAGFAELAFAIREGEESLEQTQDIVGESGSMTMLFRAPQTPITGYRHIFAQGTETELSNAFNLVFSYPNLKLKMGNASVDLISGQPEPGAWYYLGFTWDMSRNDSEIKWWFGKLGDSLSSGVVNANDAAVAGDGSSLILGSNKKFSFGNFRDENFPGLLDEPALWVRELTEFEVIQQFAATTAPVGAPFFSRQPTAVSAPEGSYAYFDVTTFGDAPITLQWTRNGVLIPGATNHVLPVGPVSQLVDSGAVFRCVASNVIGVATSSPAALMVLTPRDFQTVVSGQQPDYWFPLDASLANVGSRFAPALLPGGVTFTNDYGGNAMSAFAIVGGQDRLEQTQDILAPTGTMTLLFRTPEVPLTGFRHVFGQGADTATSNAWNMSFGNPNLGFKAGNASTTLITGQPIPGTWYFFSATWDESRNAGEVLWHFGPVGGALASGTLNLADDAVVGAGGSLFLGNKDGGFSALRETNSAGRVDEAMVWSRELSAAEILDQFITTAAPLGFPYILNQPQNSIGKDGETVTFGVTALGQAPLTYQWRSNGVPMAGATSSNILFGPVSLVQTGLVFDVVVSNALGVVTSQTASLTVSPLSDYQALIQSQTPDYWFRLDNSFINRGVLPAPDLASSGGSFSQDVARVAASAYYVSAVNGYLRQPNDIVSPTGSISLLFRTPDVPLTGFRHLLGQGVDTATSNSFNITFNNANLVFRMGNGQATLVSGPPAAGSWYYFAATWDEARDAEEVKWYFGKAGTTLVSSNLNMVDTALIGNDGPFFVGNRDDVAAAAWRMSVAAPGAVDEVALWGRELLSTEVAAQFDQAFPVVSQLAGSNLVFRSSGAAAGSGWTLSENGFVGCFIQAATPATVTVSAAMSGLADGGIFPRAALRIGNDSAGFYVDSAGVYSNTFILPQGTHAIRVELTNAPYGSSRALTVNSLSLTGAGASLYNEADDSTCLEASRTFIEHGRKGNVQLTIVNSLGVTQANAQVSVVLKRHAFRFGVATSGLRTSQDDPPASQLNWLSGSSPNAAPYRAFVSNYFNLVGFRNGAKWNPHEQVRDVQTLALQDQLLGFAESNKMAVRIHAVGWANDTFHPPWAQTLYTNGLAGNASDAAEFRAELSERLSYLVRDRAHRYDELDVINEDYHKPGYAALYGTNGWAGMYVEAKTNLLAAGGRARAFVNEFNVLRYEIENGSYLLSYANWYRRHIEALEAAAGQPVVDGIGIQGHVNTEAAARAVTPNSIRRNFQTLLHLGVLGKPISITEFDVTNDDGAGAPLPVAEATNILLTSMTTFFGSPGVQTFTLWDFWEPAMDPDKTGVALVDSNWVFTAAGVAFTNRMAEWSTRAAGPADGEGRFAFRGFFGDYVATVTAPGGTPTNIAFSLLPGTSLTSIVLVAEGGAPSTNNYSTVIQSQNPDYWFRLSSNFVNSGVLPASNMIPNGGSFGTDYDGVTDRAFRITGAANYLAQSNDLIKGTGSLSMLFRTPNVTLGFRHVFAQGDDTAPGNAFNLVHANPNLNFRVGNASATVLAGIPATGTWYYLAATWDDTRDAGEVRWWFGPAGGALTQGVLNIGDTNAVGNNSTIYLGNRAPGFNVAFQMTGAPGTLDEFAVWESELTAASISNQFLALNQGIEVPPPPSLPALPPPPASLRALPTPGLPALGFPVVFESLPGVIYQIYWASSLLPGVWQSASSLTATGTVSTWYDLGDSQQGRLHPAFDPNPRFYQVRTP